jgi:hypothetical protein
MSKEKSGKTKEKNTAWGKLAFAVTYIYILFVLWGQYALLDSIFPQFLVFIGMLALAAVLTTFLLRWCSKWHIDTADKMPEKKEIKKWAVIISLITIAFLLVFYYARFPGVYFKDSVKQLDEMVLGDYEDWHPFIYNLLAFIIPFKLGGLWLIELTQIIWYAVAVTYMICSLRYYGCPKKLCVLIYAFIMLMPDTAYVLLFPMKDCAFAILTMLLVTDLLHIIKTDGKWLEKKYNVVLLAVILVAATLVRHNGILFTAPLLAAVIYYSRRYVKRIVALLIVSALLIFTVKVPVYRLFDVEKAGSRTTEVVGICMVMMGNALVEAPQLLSQEVIDFLYSVEPENVWEEYYKLGDWNNVKWKSEDMQFQAIEETGTKKILEYTADTLYRCPNQCIRAFLAVTGMVWQTDGERHWKDAYRKYAKVSDLNLETEDSPCMSLFKSYEFDLNGAEYIRELQEQYIDIVENSPLAYIFCYVGLLNMIIILLLFSRKKHILGTFLTVLPVVAYSYGTALLLSAYDCRFFYYTYGCFFVIMFIILSRDNVNEGKQINE